MTPSEEIIGRYARVEREPDALGRLIGVRRLKVSQQTKVSEWTPGLEGVSEVQVPETKDPETGETIPARAVEISRRTQMLVAAAVCEIDSIAIPFARSRGELDAIADRLDEEGLVAAMVAYGRVHAASTPTDGVVDAAKK
jgi:hypothetical protein